MLTRIRIEAEGPTIQAVQEDLFAAYDALVEVVYGPLVVPATTYGSEVFESTEPRDPYHIRWYKGRASVAFPLDEPYLIGAERVRPRIEWLAEQDRMYEFGGEVSPGTEHDGLERTRMGRPAVE